MLHEVLPCHGHRPLLRMEAGVHLQCRRCMGMGTRSAQHLTCTCRALLLLHLTTGQSRGDGKYQRTGSESALLRASSHNSRGAALHLQACQHLQGRGVCQAANSCIARMSEDNVGQRGMRSLSESWSESAGQGKPLWLRARSPWVPTSASYRHLQLSIHPNYCYELLQLNK